MIAGNQMVHIDEDELLEELEALKEQEQEKIVLADGVIRVDGEIIKLPSVPHTEIVIKPSEIEPVEIEASPKQKEPVLIPE